MFEGSSEKQKPKDFPHTERSENAEGKIPEKRLKRFEFFSVYSVGSSEAPGTGQAGVRKKLVEKLKSEGSMYPQGFRDSSQVLKIKSLAESLYILPMDQNEVEYLLNHWGSYSPPLGAFNGFEDTPLLAAG